VIGASAPEETPLLSGHVLALKGPVTSVGRDSGQTLTGIPIRRRTSLLMKLMPYIFLRATQVEV
jgi:hypothetical protein